MPRALFGCRLDFRMLSGLCEVCCVFSTLPLCYEFWCWFWSRSAGAPAPLHVSLEMPALTVSRRLTLLGAGRLGGVGPPTTEQVQGSASVREHGRVGSGRRSLGVAGTCPSCLLVGPLQVSWLEEKSVGASLQPWGHRLGTHSSFKSPHSETGAPPMGCSNSNQAGLGK